MRVKKVREKRGRKVGEKGEREGDVKG